MTGERMGKGGGNLRVLPHLETIIIQNLYFVSLVELLYSKQIHDSSYTLNQHRVRQIITYGRTIDCERERDGHTYR